MVSRRRKSPTRNGAEMRCRLAVFAILLLPLLSSGIACVQVTNAPRKDGVPPLKDAGASATPTASPAGTDVTIDRRRLLGTWQDHYQGTRTMTLKDDGTATMVVELKGIQANLMAPRLTFDMRWSLEGKILKKRSIGGEPREKVRMVLNMMGSVAEDTIQELTDDRLLLLDKNGQTKYDWKRIKRD